MSICYMGRFWCLPGDKVLVPAPVWDQDPMVQSGVCPTLPMLMPQT